MIKEFIKFQDEYVVFFTNNIKKDSAKKMAEFLEEKYEGAVQDLPVPEVIPDIPWFNVKIKENLIVNISAKRIHFILNKETEGKKEVVTPELLKEIIIEIIERMSEFSFYFNRLACVSSLFLEEKKPDLLLQNTFFKSAKIEQEEIVIRFNNKEKFGDNLLNNVESYQSGKKTNSLGEQNVVILQKDINMTSPGINYSNEDFISFFALSQEKTEKITLNYE